MIASGFSWFHLIPGIEGGDCFLPGVAGPCFPFAHGHGYLFATAWFVCAVLILFAFAANRGLKARLASSDGLERYHTDDTLTVRNIAEIFVGGISGLMNDLMDRDNARRFLPLVGGLFAYIFVSNMLGIFPGFLPPTDNINANIGMGVVVLVAYWGAGLIFDAKGFFKHLMGPVLLLAPLMLLIELISLLAVRPGSLAVRLTGNMFGDHTVFNIMSGLVPVLVPVAFLALAMLVSTIQAFVFSLLTTIYISQSLPHGDHDDHSHH